MAYMGGQFRVVNITPWQPARWPELADSQVNNKIIHRATEGIESEGKSGELLLRVYKETQREVVSSGEAERMCCVPGSSIRKTKEKSS